MHFLTATTDKLQLVRSSAATLHTLVSYIDADTAGLTSPAAGREPHAFNTAGTDDLLAAPASSKTRTPKRITIRNYDASLACDVTVVLDANGTDYEIHKVTLNPGEGLEYVDGLGWYPLKPAGLLDVMKIMASDSVHATAATFADITGLTHPLLSGKKYAIEAWLFHISNATTTGAQFGYNIGAAPTLVIFGNISGVTNQATGGTNATFSLGTATARDTAITGQTTGSAAITVTSLVGMIQPSADGTFALRATSEVSVAAGLTVKAGSWMRIRQEG